MSTPIELLIRFGPTGQKRRRIATEDGGGNVLQIKQSGANLGVVIEGFDPATARDADISELKIYVLHTENRCLKNQEFTAGTFVEFGRRLGEPVPYYEPIYHHPDSDLIFVSSNVPKDGQQVGVPKTGKFWHSDYQFMDNPFGITVINPQVVPRGTGAPTSST